MPSTRKTSSLETTTMSDSSPSSFGDFPKFTNQENTEESTSSEKMNDSIFPLCSIPVDIHSNSLQPIVKLEPIDMLSTLLASKSRDTRKKSIRSSRKIEGPVGTKSNKQTKMAKCGQVKTVLR